MVTVTVLNTSLLSSTAENDEGEVVAVATGSGGVTSSNISVDGRVLIDSHAMIKARRALIKYVIIYMKFIVYTFVTCGQNYKYILKNV